MHEDLAKKWEEFFSPNELRIKLISASLFLTAFEMLRESIVGRIKMLYCSGFNETGPIYDKKYTNDVLSLHKRTLSASTLWLNKNNIITNEDCDTIFELIKQRNNVAHELPLILYGSTSVNYQEWLPKLAKILKKVEIWWVVNFEIPTNPDFDGIEIDEENVSTGPLTAFEMLCDLALGNKEEANLYLIEFQKFMAKKRSP